jgi:hypothetical protein
MKLVAGSLSLTLKTSRLLVTFCGVSSMLTDFVFDATMPCGVAHG